MNKFLIAALLSLMAAPASADQYGIAPVGGAKQASGTTTSGSTQVTLSAKSNYVMVNNESATIWAYVTCNGNAAIPSAAAANSTPVAPNGTLLLYIPSSSTSCATITASSTAMVDFTPVNVRGSGL